MNNSTTTNCSLLNTGTDVRVWQIGAFVLPMIGLPGHILLIITMLSTNQRRYPMSLYFMFMSIVESLYLAALFWDWLDAVNLAPDPRQILDCAFFYPFVIGTSLMSLCLLAQLNLDRIYMIRQPKRAHLEITHRRIIIKTLVTFIIITFIMFHYRFSLYYEGNAFVIYGQSCRIYSRAYIWFHWIWPYFHFIVRIGTSLIIIRCSLILCRFQCARNDHNHHKIRSSHIRRQQQTFSLVLVLMGIYTFFAALPITIVQLVGQHIWKYELEDFHQNCTDKTIQANKWKLINAICIMWEASTYMNKFYVKFFFAPQFRHDVKQVLSCRYMRKSHHITVSNRSIRNNSKTTNSDHDVHS